MFGNGVRVWDYFFIWIILVNENLVILKDEVILNIEVRIENYLIRMFEEKIICELEVMEVNVSLRNEIGNKNFDVKRGEM